MNNNSHSNKLENNSRPKFPKRAVVTAGMPYGNKNMHFGHIGGVFVHADILARFLRDRIGNDNVIFISGIDCYGSSVIESYRVLLEDKKFDGTLEDFVRQNYKAQCEVLREYDISLNLYASSAFDRAAEIHKDRCSTIIKELYAKDSLERRSTLQFYDSVKDVFLTGRQVIGRCPIQSCRSEIGYADECSLGHQYEPKELIAPKSKLSGTAPTMREVENWYFKLPEYREILSKWLDNITTDPWSRPFVVSAIAEFLKLPVIYVKQNELDRVKTDIKGFPDFELQSSQSESIGLKFDTLSTREEACSLLSKHGIRFRTGKTLVPFRLTGSAKWGVPTPVIEDLKELTFWVWPESLFAPISFTEAYLEQKGEDKDNVTEWWYSKDSNVYQFIGEDNIFFYSLAEIAMFMSMNRSEPSFEPNDGDIQLPIIIANKHLLFLSKKASSSSSEIKPPMAHELLDYYTSDQLRAHFLSFGVSSQNASFQPKVLNPAADPRAGDPVLKEGNLLSNVFNRAVRTCFYTMQKQFDGKLPSGKVSENVKTEADNTILKYEENMYLHKFHLVMSTLDAYIRNITQHWAKNTTRGTEAQVNPQILIDTFHMVRVATVLMHPIAPYGTEIVREYLNVGKEFWNWDRIFDTLDSFITEEDHCFKVLEPRVDFFEKHPSQIKKK